MKIQRSSLASALITLVSLIQPGCIAPLGTPAPSNIAAPEFREHHPRIVTRKSDNQLYLLASNRDGVGRNLFDMSSGWSGWQMHGFPANISTPPDLGYLGPSIPTSFDNLGYGFSQLGAFAYPAVGGSVDLALPFWGYRGSFGWITMALPSTFTGGGLSANEFRAETVLADSPDFAFTFYGTPDADKDLSRSKNNPLLELRATWVPGSGNFAEAATIMPSLDNLGRPVINGIQASVVLGPNSAVSVPITRNGLTRLHHFVFVRALAGTEDHLTYFYRDEAGRKSWGPDLGAPERTNGYLVDGPVAIVYVTSSGLCKMNVFVTAYDRELERYVLFERHWADSGSGLVEEGWLGDWRRHAFPIDHGNGQPLLASGTKFRMTTAAVWLLDDRMRINMFGWADQDSNGPERLIEYVWDGSSWSWGNVHALAPGDLGVQTSSMAVIDSPPYKRLSVICRAGNGAIYEHYYLIDQGGWRGWFWNDLTMP